MRPRTTLLALALLLAPLPAVPARGAEATLLETGADEAEKTLRYLPLAASFVDAAGAPGSLEVLAAGDSLIVSGRLRVAPAEADLDALAARAKERFGQEGAVAAEPAADLSLDLFLGTRSVWHRPAAGGASALQPVQFMMKHPGDTKPVELILRGRIGYETTPPPLDLSVRVEGAAFLAALTREAALSPDFTPVRFAKVIEGARAAGALKFKGDRSLAAAAGAELPPALLERLARLLAPRALSPDPLPPDPADPATLRHTLRQELSESSFRTDYDLRVSERVRREHAFATRLSFVPPEPEPPGPLPSAGPAPAPDPPEAGGEDAEAKAEARMAEIRRRIPALAKDMGLYRRLARTAEDPERRRTAKERADAIAKERAGLLEELARLRDRPAKSLE